MSRSRLALLFLSALFTFCATSCKNDSTANDAATAKYRSPEEVYGDLFIAVQIASVFPDGKTFADCTPKVPVKEILAAYEAQKNQEKFDLRAFVLQYFDPPHKFASGFVSDTTRSAQDHINALWDVLTRSADDASTGTLIPLPNPYVVPGGRFGEVYYWDSYFTMLGLQSAGKVDMMESMVDNFAYLIDELGFIPNGNRTYYNSRSQPPFFALMAGLLAEAKGNEALAQYLPQLEKEYNFWMDGSSTLSDAKPTHRRAVRLIDGAILNRYWDDRKTPRAESYREDLQTAGKSGRPAEEVYRHLRAACESGWDFSSRWLADGKTLTTIHTADIIPVDLNALLYNLEMTLSKAHSQKGDQAASKRYFDIAQKRAEVLINYCWDAEKGYFMDYDFIKNQRTDVVSAAGMYPLFFGIATPEQAKSAAVVLERELLKPGGIVTTANATGQQWDAPNGWAPLQWISIQGLRKYGNNDLAQNIRQRWTHLNVKVYKNTGKMVEKYNVLDMTLQAGGGEYPVQDGFGWTNGVLLKLLSENSFMD
ncbi:MAG: alpha,alpha-trehalase TreF [Saprospiraceae bacterium]